MNTELEKPDPAGQPTMDERLDRIERRMVRGFRAQQNRAAQHLCAVMFVITVHHYTKADSFDWKSWWHGWSETLTAVADRSVDLLRFIAANANWIAPVVMGLLLSFCLWPSRQRTGQEEPGEHIAFRLGQALRRVIRTR
jgi:hypothetical protein